MTMTKHNLSAAFCQFSKRISTYLALSLNLTDTNDIESNKQYLQYIHTDKQAHLGRKCF